MEVTTVHYLITIHWPQLSMRRDKKCELFWGVAMYTLIILLPVRTLKQTMKNSVVCSNCSKITQTKIILLKAIW